MMLKTDISGFDFKEKHLPVCPSCNGRSRRDGVSNNVWKSRCYRFIEELELQGRGCKFARIVNTLTIFIVL